MKEKTNRKVRNPVWYLFTQAWRHASEDRKKIGIVWITFLVAGSINLYVIPIAWAKITDLIQFEGLHRENLWQFLMLLLVMLLGTIVFWVIHGPARVYERVCAFNIRTRYRSHFLQGVMNMPLVWHSSRHSGDTIDRVDKGTRALFDFSEDSFEIIYTFVKLIGSFAMLLYFFPASSVGVCVMMVFTCWITTRFDKVLMEQYTTLNAAENKVTQLTFDTISNITTVIILRVEKLLFDTIMGKVRESDDLFRRNCKLNEWKWFITSLCCTFTITIVLATYFWTHAAQSIPVKIGELYLLYRYLGNISEVFSRFAGIYGEVMKSSARLQNAEALADQFTVQTFANHVLPSQWQVLSIRGLDFAYDSGAQSALNLSGVDLDIKRGERIALIGESGSGKTTLLKLIRGLYEPQKLSLSVDGADIEDGFEGIARAISLIPQAPEIFNTTIRENITLGANHPEDAVLRSIDLAEFTSVLANLPDGLSSGVNEKGVNLSGGQQQRLALARGILASQGRDIVLLDEPTSSLDTATEHRVYQNIFQAFEGQTIISSIHRLHLLTQFDRICVFDKGKLIASGTLAELLVHCPLFIELWQRYQKASDAGTSV